MKLYKKMIRVFTVLSIILLLLSVLFIFLLHNNELGYYLLGLFGSCLIIIIQSYISSIVEKSKVIMGKLRDLNDVCSDLSALSKRKIDLASMYYEDYILDVDSEILKLRDCLSNIYGISGLDKKTFDIIDSIIDKLTELILDTSIILKRCSNDDIDKITKRIYYLELHKILENFDFTDILVMIWKLGDGIDSVEFSKEDYNKTLDSLINMKYHDTSIRIYDSKLKEEHKIEYDALEGCFELPF